MKRGIVIFSIFILIFGCKKEDSIDPEIITFVREYHFMVHSSFPSIHGNFATIEAGAKIMEDTVEVYYYNQPTDTTTIIKLDYLGKIYSEAAKDSCMMWYAKFHTYGSKPYAMDSKAYMGYSEDMNKFFIYSFYEDGLFESGVIYSTTNIWSN